MKLNRKHIPYLAAAVQTAQYALAGYFLIGPIGWFFVGSMGALVSLALAYGASQFSTIAQARKKSSFIAMIAIMLFSPILIGTATWLHLTNIANPYWRGVVSAAWGLLPDMAVALSGFIAGKGLVEQDMKPRATAQQSKSRGRKRRATAQQSKSRGRKRRTTAKQTSRAETMSEQAACRWGCGLSGTKGAMNAHSKFCANNPANQFEKAVNNKEK
jgi:hypothetical protein